MDSSNSIEENKEFNVDLKSLEVPLEKYPMAESKNMFENFLIIGYDELYFQEKILNVALNLRNNQSENNKTPSKNKKNSEKSNKFCCRNLPIILSSITSDFEGMVLNGDLIIKNVFPIPPEIFVDFEGKESSSEKKNYFLIFSNIQNNVVNYGFGYIFYERKGTNEITIHVPKAFVIISQYPFFKIFNNLCEEILELFNKNQQLQIPIEIQIYNIINFVPASVDIGLKMTFIPKQDLYLISCLKNQDEFFNSDEQQKYYAAQLNGYRATEINFCYLLNALPRELILEIYLNLISGRIIGVFYKNICDLSLILHSFYQFLFPFAPSENVSCLSPIKFFCNDTVDQNLVGFLCNYDELEMYDPFRELKEGEFRCLTDEEENIELDILYFKCDYILDLNKKVLKEPEFCTTQDDNGHKNKQLNSYIKKLIGKKKAESEFEEIFLQLSEGLDENVKKLSNLKHNKDKNILKYFINEDTQHLNKLIIKLFYEFNLRLANVYYKNISQYNGDFSKTKEEQINITIKSQKDSGLNADEYFFFSCFASSLFCNTLENFIGGYGKNEPKIYKAPKLIFEHLLYYLKIKLLYKKKAKSILNILSVYDEIYINKIKNIDDNKDDKEKNKDAIKKVKKDKKGIDRKVETEKFIQFYDNEKKKASQIMNMNRKTFTFFEFYKYYVSSPEIPLYFYNISNPEFVSGKIIKTSQTKIKYIFKYKKIELDQNMIFKYIYKLKQMDEETKEKCFKNITQAEMEQKEPIRTYENFISSALERYYIENKYFDNLELLNLSVLGFAILTVSKHKLINYTKEINEIIGNLTFSTRKFAKIFLSVSLRYFFKEKVKNSFISEKYFDIYKFAIENKNIFPDDELILIQSKIELFKKLFKEGSDITLTEEKKDYKFEYNKKALKKLNFVELNQDLNPKLKININIKFKYKKMKFEYPSIYYIQKLYGEIYNLINDYYKDLDYNIILNRKDEFNKLIIYLLFYTDIATHPEKVKEKKDKKNKEENEKYFNENIKNFLIDCLEI